MAHPQTVRTRVPLGATRRVELLRALRDRGPSTVGELAAATGLHENTTRDHLRLLVDEGYAERDRGVPSGRGRPGMRYRAVREVPDAAVVDRQAGELVAQTALARALLDGYGVPAPDVAEQARLAGLRASDLLAGTPDPGHGRAAQLAALTAHLERLGFDPEPGEDAATVRLRRCPYLGLARDRPDVVCGVHLGLAQGVLERVGGPVCAEAIEPFAVPDACVLRLSGSAG